MKRHGNLFEKIVEYDNIYLAYKNARKGKSHYREVKMVDENPEYYIKEIQKMLINKTYTTSKYEIYNIIDKGKDRKIYKLPFYPDRIIQWAIMLQVEDIFLKHFINQTYAAIPEKGTHKALTQLDKYMKDREGTQYCLKIDVKKFFPNINMKILKKLLRKKFKDKELLWLLDDIVDSCEDGVPIGNYTSQYLGNFYLSFLDHWMKEDKKVKYFMRYMDDMVILHHDKEYLHQLRKDIEDYLFLNLDLELKGNWQVFPTYVRGVDFVGYRHFGDYILLRKSTATTLKRKMRKILKKCQDGKIMNHNEWSSINSYNGWILYCDGNNLNNKFIKPLLPYTNEYYEKHVKSKKKGNKEEVNLYELLNDDKGVKTSISFIIGKETELQEYKINTYNHKNEEELVLYVKIKNNDELLRIHTKSKILISEIRKAETTGKLELPIDISPRKIENGDKYYYTFEKEIRKQEVF